LRASVAQDSTTCKSGTGQCLELPIIYRDFQPENVSPGGHPDFFFLGTKKSPSTSPTTICVPNSGGPSKGNDSTARCWGIMASNLLNGKPQPGTTTTCACQFSDWNIGNTARIPRATTQAANDSPLSNGAGGYVGGTAGTVVSVTGNAGVSAGTLTGYTASMPGGPIWKGTTPAFKDANSFKQWFNDDNTVNKTFTDVLEMPSIGGNVYQYASQSHLDPGWILSPGYAESFPGHVVQPVALLEPWQRTSFWTTCTGDQYLFPPRIVATDAATCDPVVTLAADLAKGCWQDKLVGVKHDSYFTDEARYYFVYDGTTGISLSFYGDDDLFIFINGVLVLDLGGVHQQLPGKVTVTGAQATRVSRKAAASTLPEPSPGSPLAQRVFADQHHTTASDGHDPG
jgi:fibro-slime domain-containing protein